MDQLIEILESVESALAEAVSEADRVYRLNLDDENEAVFEALIALENVGPCLDAIQARLAAARNRLDD